MGKEKKKKHQRDRSSDRRHRHKKSKKHKRADSESEDSDGSDSADSRSRSPKQKERYRSRSRSPKRNERYRSRSRSPKCNESRRYESRSPRRYEEKSKSHKKHYRDSSSASSDAGSSDDERFKQREKKKFQNIELSKEERRRQKELMKTYETPEEKRARRMAKKDAKERKKKEQMGWDKDYLGYTNSDNPFGDETLLETFTWKKKNEKEGVKVQSHDEMQRIQKQKMDESRRELEKVKKRRLERERELDEREREREQLQRDKEAEYYREWEKQEDHFHLNQAKLRSQIRIQDGRAKPIDLLAKYISAEDDVSAIEMHEPYTYLYGLTITDMEDLLEDIKVYLELEEGKNADYWRDIITVTNDELSKLRKLDNTQKDYRDRREGINESVNSEVGSIFKGKTTNQLQLLETQINQKLNSGEGVDIGYWESLIQQLKAHMARTRLRERHQEVLRQKLFKLKQEQGIESAPLFPAGDKSDSPVIKQEKTDMPPPAVPTVSRGEEPGTSGEQSHPAEEEEEEGEALITEDDLEEQAYVDYEAGCYSPKLLTQNDLEIDSVVYEVADDIKKLELAREQVKTSGQVRLDADSEFEKKAREGMNDDEAQFSVEVPLTSQAFLWSDKYRPRKPRFFNRVHTGFEWNKYNQTHYDIDNPPPKIVQGYKFNIFYPDLIDKTKPPEYTLTPCEDNKDFAILRYRAGPPYEDIAFKVVNREWEYSYKRGFRCQFQNNIFQMWFHFKRYRYRR
ncbi:splicing factor Cactin-like [Mytilus galloprovincialis]|uniref:splicing factor Cactin-like n=1 Tax=Mytilus galloprovincialis TaxID=29158 RepID=UPI003F7BABD0